MSNSTTNSEQFFPTISDIIFVEPDGYSKSSNSIVVDDGINYGLGFFETILILDKPIFLKEHSERLNKSLRNFNMPIYVKEELIAEAIKLYKITNSSLKVLVTANNIILSTRELYYTDDDYQKGASLCLSNIIRSSKSPLVNHKSLNYGDMLLSLRRAHDLGFNDCLFFNEKGFLTETAIANVFIVKDNQIFTPKVNDGLLPGIVRDYLIKRYDIIESLISVDDLAFAEGIFLTNSLVGIVKVSSIHFDKAIIRQNRLIQFSDTLYEIVNYSDHDLIQKLQDEYRQFISS